MLLVILAVVACVAALNVTDSFHACISGLDGLTALTAVDTDFANVSQAFNLRVSYQPVAIVYPTSTEEVQQLVICGTQLGMNISARSGGHSYAGYGLAGDLVLDLRNMSSITVYDNGTAVVETGNTIGSLAQGLWNQGQRALPHGTCPYVGTGGHALFGGFGYYSRTAGLLLDRIVSADVVLANGTIVVASNNSNQDIFWALRGAGASYGIVTAWTFDTLAAPANTVIYSYILSALAQSDIVFLYLNVQQFATTLSPEAAMIIVISPDGTGHLSMEISGAYYGDEDNFQSTFSPLVSQLPINSIANITSYNWIDGLAAVDGPLSTASPDVHDTFFAKSLMVTQPYSNSSVTSWMDYLYTQGASSELQWFVEVDLWGGVISSIASNATSFAHRDALFTIQFYASSSNNEPPYPSTGISFVDGILSSLEPNPQAAYPNYVDPTLATNQWPALYYGSNYNRLAQIKLDVDPNNVFAFQQSIVPVASNGSSSAPSPQSSPSSSSPQHASNTASSPRPRHYATSLLLSPVVIFLYTLSLV